MRHAYFVQKGKESSKNKADWFKDKGKKKAGSNEEAQLNIVMDYIPSNVYRIQKHFLNLRQQVHPLLIKLYTY